MQESVPFLSFVSEHKPGALRLDGFPLLCHCPQEFGEGVRTNCKGIPAADIAAWHKGDFSATARFFETTEAHVRNAVAWMIMHPDA